MIVLGRRQIAGLLGQCGAVEWLRSMGTHALVACYANPCESSLWHTVPIPSWPNAAANDEWFFGPTEAA